ncbi:putative membrane protein [Rhodococcus sp. MTM3W5.2]|nr:putative membrane protein [Rhodococcus sp. MTM3W5.2]
MRAYVRDLVDSRRHLVGLFMPLALLLIMAMFLSPAIQSIVTLGMLVLMLFMLAEGTSWAAPSIGRSARDSPTPWTVA